MNKFCKIAVSFLCSALVVFCAVVSFFPAPASAVEPVQDSYVGVIQFDQYRVGSGALYNYYVSEWPGNIAGSSMKTTYLGQFGYVDVYPVSGGFFDVTYVGIPSFVLTSTNNFVNPESLIDWEFIFGVDGLDVYQVTVACWYEYPIVASDGWELDNFRLNFTVSNDYGESLKLGEMLYTGIRQHTGSDLVYLNGLTLSFTQISAEDTANNPEVTFRMPCVSNSLNQNSASSWFQGLELPYTVVEQVVDGTILEWVVESVQGFLSAPIIGDFSFGGLLTVVISVALCVLLAKILG